MTYTAVDCLGFAGGFTLGVVRAGFELIGKREMPGAFGVANCERNRHLLGYGWETGVSAPPDWEPLSADLVFGNPPCSGFSVMTDKRWRGVDAKINECMHAFATYAARCDPLIVVMESVRSAFSNGHELMRLLRKILEDGTGHRYDLYHVMQNAHDLGGAAFRPRYFWVASRVPFGVEWPELRRPTLADAWSDLDGLELTWLPQPYRRPATWWAESARNVDGVVDGHVPAQSPYINRALDLLHENGGWPQGAHLALVARQLYDRRGYLPESWALKMPKILHDNFHMGYTTMTRWVAGRPARVITGGALNLVLHPTEDRTITHREAARVMGFPDDWLIRPLRGVRQLGATWGKGITVQCGEWIAAQVRNALDGIVGSDRGTPVGEREWLVGMKPPRQLRDRLAAELDVAELHQELADSLVEVS